MRSVSDPNSRGRSRAAASPRGRERLKRRILSLYGRIARSPLRAPLYHLENARFAVRYRLLGKPKITAADRENVERNVTFIYKSFNRQKKAAALYRCIKSYYPGVRVIIADDSREPLEIADMAEGDEIVHLPFNSGLSKGLIAALEKVETPYTMRMDDDELLTPKTDVHGQLAFLQKHGEVDLVGVQATHRHPERMAARMRRFTLDREPIIPFGTVIDGREVVFKPKNVFLVRTGSLRLVGYDPNIRMNDHHEFFYRAAGRIVCVQDPKAFVMHCHNHYEKKEYSRYRGDVAGDLRYVAAKHGAEYWRSFRGRASGSAGPRDGKEPRP